MYLINAYIFDVDNFNRVNYRYINCIEFIIFLVTYNLYDKLFDRNY